MELKLHENAETQLFKGFIESALNVNNLGYGVIATDRIRDEETGKMSISLKTRLLTAIRSVHANILIGGADKSVTEILRKTIKHVTMVVYYTPPNLDTFIEGTGLSLDFIIPRHLEPTMVFEGIFELVSVLGESVRKKSREIKYVTAEKQKLRQFITRAGLIWTFTTPVIGEDNKLAFDLTVTPPQTPPKYKYPTKNELTDETLIGIKTNILDVFGFMGIEEIDVKRVNQDNKYTYDFSIKFAEKHQPSAVTFTNHVYRIAELACILIRARIGANYVVLRDEAMVKMLAEAELVTD